MAEPRLRRKIQDSRIQRQRGLFPTTAGAGLAARMDPEQRISTMISRRGEVGVRQPRTIVGEGGLQAEREPGTGQLTVTGGPNLLSPKELNRRYSDLGVKFDRPMTEEGAALTAELARARMIRDSIIRREPTGALQTGLGLGASLLNMALDPLEVASVFVPVVSQARQAAWIARSGAIAGRARVGLVEGAAGNLMMEPSYMALSKSLQMDYGMGDAIANVFLGSVLGGALGGGLGAARLGRRRLTLTEDMRTPMRLTEEMRLDVPVDMVDALNLSRVQRERLPVGEAGQTQLTLRPVEERTPARADLPSNIRENIAKFQTRGARQSFVESQLDKHRKLKANAKTEKTRVKHQDIIDGLQEALGEILDEGSAELRSALGRRVELVDKDGNAIDLEPEQASALAAAINGPSPAQRGQALKGAIAQMAQGKSVRVAEVAEDISRLKNRERLARGRVTQIRNELERARAEGDAERVRDLEGRLARAEDQHRIAKAEVEAGRTETAGRVAQEEQQLDRSAMYEPEKVTELEEKAKRPDLPDEAEVNQEITDLRALLKQKVEAGEMTEGALENLTKELEQLDGSVEAFGRATEYMKLCLRR